MSSIVDALYELKYNPFEYSSFIASFYSSLSASENNFLLAPLVIPLCSHPIFSSKLFYSNSKSTMWTIFDDRAKLYDLQERIDGFQELTELCIQYCMINDWLSVDEDNLILRASFESHSAFDKKKTGDKLGRLFSGHSVIEIYALLGVKPQ